MTTTHEEGGGRGRRGEEEEEEGRGIGGGGLPTSPTFFGGGEGLDYTDGVGARRRGQQQHSSPSSSSGLSEWIEGRQRAFRDFERSFQPTPSSAVPPEPLFLLSRRPTATATEAIQPALQQQDDILPPFEQESGGGGGRIVGYIPGEGNRPPFSAMLSRHGGSDLSSGDRDLSPKARVTYDEGRFQVELDVRDYRPEELSIKTEGDVLVVLARHETKSDGGGSSFVSKQFEQRFTLPSGVRPEAITSSLARDGTLTVTAPREKSASELQAIRAPSSPSGIGGAPANVFGHGGGGGGGAGGGAEDDGDGGLPHPRVKYDEDKFQISLDCQKYRPEELDVKVEGSTIIITAKQEMKEAGGTRTRVFEQKFTLPSGVRAEKVSSTFGKDGVLTITAPRGSSSSSNGAPSIRPGASVSSVSSAPHHRPSQHDISSDMERRMDRVLSPSSWEDNFQRRESGSIGTGITSLGGGGGGKPRSGSLFDRGDPFLLSSSSPSPHGHDNGISKVEVDDDNYKILVDVRDFRPEELVIKTVGNTVHFEAKHEEKTADGHSFTSRNISQSFTLPRGVDPEAVTSSLSKEGTLTIAAPLPQPAIKLQSNERLVPIKHR